MPGVIALRRSHGLQGMPASVAGVDAWGRPNAAEVPSDHHEGLREHGEWPKLALIAVIRKLVARGDIFLAIAHLPPECRCQDGVGAGCRRTRRPVIRRTGLAAARGCCHPLASCATRPVP